MKTIKELNEKWWYRSLKILCFVLMIPLTFYLIYELVLTDPSNKPSKIINEKSSYITCIKSKDNFSLLENDLKTISFWKNSPLSPESSIKAEKICALSFLGIEEYNKLNSSNSELSTTNQIIATRMYGSYEINPVFTEVPRNWIIIFSQAFLIIILSFVTVDLIRRVFYYIALGSFKPKKE